MHASWFAPVVQLQDSFDFIQGEPEVFGFEYEPQSVQVRLGVGAVSGAGSWGIRDQALSLIKPDCFGR